MKIKIINFWQAYNNTPEPKRFLLAMGLILPCLILMSFGSVFMILGSLALTVMLGSKIYVQNMI